MRLLHLSPTWFGRGSIVGGGERYAWELARACAADGPTTFLSFDAQPSERTEGPLRVRLLRRRTLQESPLSVSPFDPALVSEIRRADVVHCHQADTHLTSAALVLAGLLGRRVFVSDLGGGHPHALTRRLPLLPRATGMLLLSEYSRRQWEQEPASRRPRRAAVVYGGVDDRFAPAAGTVKPRVLCVGRIMRHKGFEHAILGLDEDLDLVIAGTPYDQAYMRFLRETAAGRRVEFRETVADDALPDLYRESIATIVPSVYRAYDGSETTVPELLGLVALESMACGTPVIVAGAGSLPELVTHGETGFVVPPNDPAALRDAVRALRSDPARRDAMGRKARESVMARFTWQATARRCREAYSA